MSDATTVLVAEDRESTREIMVHLLERSGFRVLAASDGAQAVDLMSPEVAIALIDWMMPELDGLALCRLIKSSPETEHTYVIIVTARTEKSDMIRALDAGADDYMVKPLDHDELLARVRSGERIARRERWLTSAFTQVREQADIDPLTGLYNRRHLDHALADAVREAIGRGGTLALLLLDIDHFKLVNDLHGHKVGDEVLRQVAQVVAGQARERSDIVARYGGDELAVIAPETSPLCGTQLAERIRRSVAQHRIPVGDRLVSVTVSAGLATLGEHIAHAPDPVAALIEEADTRLYQAKNAGRNQVAA
ncbi:MAG TPA: diguanylate cyclase [Armatimonadota bacterium]|nr:diguanylate cyclase [Armatimonadota bacterium]